MEKSTKVGAQIYGYSVCLVAVITFLISMTGLVNAILDLGDPLHSGYTPPGSPSLASYENYKLDVMKSFNQSTAGNKETFLPDDASLRSMYEAARSEKISKVRHDSNKALLLSGLMILIAGILFITHWRWMQRLGKRDLS
jgi:hypothetical protein